MAVFLKLKNLIKELEGREFFLYFIAKGLKRFSFGKVGLVSYHLLAQPVREPGRLPKRKTALDVRSLSPAEISNTRFERPQGTIQHRLQHEPVCFGAFKDGLLVGHLWLILGAYEEDEVRCLFQPAPAGKAAWDFDVFVEPSFRVGSTFYHLWSAANSFLYQQGIQWTMSRISSFNHKSIMSHKRLGAQVVGRAVFLRLGKVQVTYCNLGPWFHFSRSSGQIPTIRVDPNVPA